MRGLETVIVYSGNDFESFWEADFSDLADLVEQQINKCP